MRSSLVFLFSAAAVVGPGPSSAALTPAQSEFFEKHIRPVLVEKCYQCHSAEAKKVKGNLLLDTREGIRAGGDSGHAVVPGKVEESLLLTALKWHDKDLRMPPEKEGGKLSDEVIANFEEWVRMGAPDPRDGSAAKVARKEWDIAEGRKFWAFQAPQVAPAPAVKDSAWPRTEIDRHLRAAQEARGLQPVADAEPRALVRRIYFDLIGLPPTPAEVEAFVEDCREGSSFVIRHSSLAVIVDRLLASPQFGERWGRHWLDVARYAESTGRERNFTFPEAWRYRDYVIAALNADKPYDEFIREQIAGDLLPAKDDAERNEHLIATGFLALGPKGLNERNREQFRMDVVDEQIDATTRAVLGVTVACARCHDHKFDPIPQRDYYAVAGIFRSTDTHFGTAGAYGKAAQKNKNGTTLLPLISKDQPASTTPAPPAQPDLPAMLRQIEKRDPRRAEQFKKMSDEQRRMVLERFAAGRFGGAAQPAPASPKEEARPDLDRLIKRLAERDPKKAKRLQDLPEAQKRQLFERYAAKLGPDKKGKKGNDPATPAGTAQPTGPVAMGVKEGSPSDCRVLVRGEIDQPADTVARGFVQVMSHAAPPAIPSSASGRLELAQWLTSPQNPLTARVAVNRVWMHLFGEGLVRTPDNFGATGEKPSHPGLLDALALQFVREGWSVKSLVRSLVLSRAYQLSSAVDRRALEVDPDNRLLWRAAPRRLEAEAIRDAILAASGQLDLAPAPASAVAAIGDGYIGRGIRPESFTDYETPKRSVYLPVVRDFVPEVLDVFDFAEPSLVVAERDVTNVPSQALYLMNHSFVRAQSAAMAKRLLTSFPDDARRLTQAYLLTLGRPPTAAEHTRAERYLRGDTEGLTRVSNPRPSAESVWSTFCQALFASAEFRYLR